MAGRTLKVFISSSMGELAPERKVIRDTILAMSMEPFAYEEDAVASSAAPKDVWERDLETSNICLVILWKKLGKWTAAEIDFALERNIPILMFVKVGDSDGDSDVEPGSTEVSEYLEPLTDPATGVLAPKWFEQADELFDDVRAAILDHLVELDEQRRKAQINSGHAPRGAGVAAHEDENGHGAVVQEARKLRGEKRPVPARRRLKRHKGPFVGRDRDKRRFAGLVRQQGFVPVTGVEGIGRKTLLEVISHEEWEDFPDGVGIQPPQSPGEGVDDLLSAIWETVNGADELGQDVRRRDAELEKLRALIALLDVELDESQTEELMRALPNSVIAATMVEAGELSVRDVELDLITDHDDLVTLFSELSFIEVPDELRRAVAEACGGAEGTTPAKVVALAEAADAARVDESTLAEWLAGQGPA